MSLKITLSLWDIGGQQRFEFFNTDFFKGTAAIGIVFDISRPDTFDKIDIYLKDIRKRSGNIPIILVGNKHDLADKIGETISHKKVIQNVNKYNLIDYIETSALKDFNVDLLFRKLAISALLDFRPRLGEIVDYDDYHFRFKILLTGAAAVGKSSLINKFVEKGFETDYKLTIGIDLMVKDLFISDETLPEKVHAIIKNAIVEHKKRLKIIRKIEKTEDIELSEGFQEKILDKIEADGIKVKKKRKKNVLLVLILLFSVILILVLFHFLFGS
ncbi:MAG: hypothetical protein GF353_12805 [Candidatus Lokiarchaeota archaeon]|nr:hypothetical protein [Candidatus Lokiarchaeota archaeon]